ncbi:hypothetical protein HY798_05175 [Candidatus Falkowbacteria bacterium]|nr:hypothetical protein [Candidatus Falkowbacteria bacterium]
MANRKGREKILAIRATTPFFEQEDEKLCAEYKKSGIDLTPGEAALLSAFASAEQAKDMLKNEEDKLWINSVIEDSKKDNYLCGNKPISYATATAKKEKFEKALKTKE